LHIAHRPEEGLRLGERAPRRRDSRRRHRIFKHGTTDEVRHKILSRRQRHALFEWKQDLKPAEIFRFRDGLNALKMKNRLPAMILAQPAGFQRHAPRLSLTLRVSDKNFPQSCQSFWKISQEFSGDFALVAGRFQDACNQDPTWSWSAQ
jgi:hypothetical protein